MTCAWIGRICDVFLEAVSRYRHPWSLMKALWVMREKDGVE